MTGAGRSLWLTVDAGNSRAKLALWNERSERVLAASLGYEDVGPDESLDVAALARELGEFFGAVDVPVALAGLSSVTGDARTQALAEAVGAFAAEVRIAPDHGLENRTKDPAGVGLDRLYAAAAALMETGADTLVLDAGTALTVDAALAGEPGAFLGGAIAPGPALLSRSMGRDGGGTAHLPEVQPEVLTPALGRNTTEAMQSGVTHGFRGAAQALVASMGAEAGLERVPLVLTGGARAFLETAFPDRDVRVVPDLVHRGLLLALARSK